ncbi:GPI-anchor transamidase subunit S [Entomortierella parvispora]|uniref:GPI-anchor transamidase subunit S n=1 Tax=Entomortierella parvispora TaxID=205924 RepID=A0A9P3LRR0_9FUNG|nr:GPI-anchor transamidase subunit S [Entomortierella parvispora]
MTLPKDRTAAQDRTRRMVLLSIWIAILLGFPLWWKTTRVYRAELPFDEVEQWSQWSSCRPAFPLKINVHLSDAVSLPGSVNPQQQHEAIVSEIINKVQSSSPSSGSQNLPLEVVLVDQAWRGTKEQDILDRPSAVPGTYDFYISPTSSTSKKTSVSIKSQRQGWIQVADWTQDQISSAVAETLERVFGSERTKIQKLLDRQDEEEAAKVKTAVKYASGYQLTFSLFSGDTSNGVREWKMQEAINTYMAPFLRTMSVVSKFTVESQVQHYASLTFQPDLDATAKEYYLTPDKLPNFINTAEWSLASTVSSLPSLNFLVYVPPADQSPLVIKSGPGAPPSKTNSFLIPRWGGITVLNRPANDPILTVSELEPVMKIFLSQLRDLLGLSDLSTSVPAGSFPITFQKNEATSMTTWELDQLLRKRISENLVDSIKTLGSLARLVADTPNMVVLDPIQEDVTQALLDVKAACEKVQGSSSSSLSTGSAVEEALQHSRDALEKAESAFFDPTMVSMLYFPDEHKYAIYMPLFVPISVPLLLSLLKELKKWAAAKKEAKAKASAKKTAGQDADAEHVHDRKEEAEDRKTK